MDWSTNQLAAVFALRFAVNNHHKCDLPYITIFKTFSTVVDRVKDSVWFRFTVHI